MAKIRTQVHGGWCVLLVFWDHFHPDVHVCLDIFIVLQLPPIF